jgi:hypothetical protein
MTRLPSDGARVPLGDVRFRWRGSRRAGDVSYRVEISSTETFKAGGIWSTNLSGAQFTMDTTQLLPLASQAGALFWWRVVAQGPRSETSPDVPPSYFMLDAQAPRPVLPPEPVTGPQGELVVHALRGDEAPQFGEVKSEKFSIRDQDGTQLNGRDQMLVYAVPVWPEEDCTVAVRVRLREGPRGRLEQVFSAWSGAMDDPLRLVLDNGKLFARVEAGGGFSTPGAVLETNRWHALAAVKQGGTLTLFVDGQAAGSCAVPEFVTTQARVIALGGNPHYAGPEFLAATFADFRFYARALSAEEIQKLVAAR